MNPDGASQALEPLMGQAKAIRELLEKQAAQKKDRWERFGLISPFLSSVLIATIGGYFTYSYNRIESLRDNELKLYQARMVEMQAVEKMIPHLASADENVKEAAILTINQLATPGLATNLALLFKSEGTQRAVDQIMASSTGGPVPESANAAPLAAAPAVPGGTGQGAGWAYLGHYVSAEKRWKTWYFEGIEAETPESLAHRQFTVRAKTGALNVRSGMPTPEGDFPPVLRSLLPGTKVTVDQVREWDASGFMWARLTRAPE